MTDVLPRREAFVGPAPGPDVQFSPATPGTHSGGIREALDSLAATGGTVHLLPGPFVTDVPLVIPPHVTLEGAGYEKTNDRFSVVEVGPQFPANAGLVCGPTPEPGGHYRAIHVRDIALMRGRGAGGPVIDFTNVDHSTIERVELHGGTHGILLGWNGPANPSGADAPGEVRGDTIRIVNPSVDGILWKYRTQELWQRIEILGPVAPPENALHLFGCNKVQVNLVQLTHYRTAGVLFESDGAPPCISDIVTNFFGRTQNGGTDIVERGPSRSCGVFSGAAQSPAPFNTHGGLWIRDVRGVNDAGFVPQLTPRVPPIGTAVPNALPYPVDVYARGGSIASVEVAAANAAALPLFVTDRPVPLTGYVGRVNPGESICFRGSAPPSAWVWRAT